MRIISIINSFARFNAEQYFNEYTTLFYTCFQISSENLGVFEHE